MIENGVSCKPTLAAPTHTQYLVFDPAPNEKLIFYSLESQYTIMKYLSIDVFFRYL